MAFHKARHSSGQGTPSRAASLGEHAFGAVLWRIAKNLPPTERKPPKGPGRGKNQKTKLTFTDEQLKGFIREYRAGMSCTQLAKREQVLPSTMIKWLKGENRCNCVREVDEEERKSRLIHPDK